MMKLIVVATVFASASLLVFSSASIKVFESEALAQRISSSNMNAGVFFSQSNTAPLLRHKFNIATSSKQRVRVLLVPGHEPNFGGTEYKGLKERDLVVDLTQQLALYLSADDRFDVVVTRGKESWNPQFEKYFKEEQESIKSFAVNKRNEMRKLVNEGRVAEVPDAVPHNDAPEEVAIRLYGINKWANEYGMDLVIHIHLNDYPRKRFLREGEYSGFSIYVPEKQYSNAPVSLQISQALFGRLAEVFPVSSMPKEEMGVIEDQELIAVGSFNTVNAASLLVEYGYIYEPQFANKKIAHAIFKEMAFQTYLGLQDFFGEKESLLATPHQTTLLPFEWKTTIRKNKNPSEGVLSLQMAFMKHGLYPPEGKSKNDCPLSGIFGPCTRTALSIFQKEFTIKKEEGIVGKETRRRLNALYGSN